MIKKINLSVITIILFSTFNEFSFADSNSINSISAGNFQSTAQIILPFFLTLFANHHPNQS